MATKKTTKKPAKKKKVYSQVFQLVPEDKTISISMPRAEATPAKGFKVGIAEVKAREFITIGPDDPFWTERKVTRRFPPKGSFIRIKPPPGVDVELIAQARMTFEPFSAAIHVDAPPKPSDLQPVTKLDLGAADARDVVRDLFESTPLVLGSRGPGGDDGDYAGELQQALEEAMSAGGL